MRSQRLFRAIGKKRLSPGVSPSGEPLVYNERRSRIKIQAFSPGSEWGVLSSFFLFQGCQLKRRCWRIKKGSQVSPTTLKMGTKKARVSLINGTPWPVTVLSDYREKGKT